MKFLDVGYEKTPLTNAPFHRHRRRSGLRRYLTLKHIGFTLFFAFFIASLIRNYKLAKTLRDRRICPPNALGSINLLNSVDPVNSTDVSHRRGSIETYAPSMNERAIVSSLYSEAYLPGVLTLAQSLTTVHTSARLLLFYFPERISRRATCLAREAGWELVPVERIYPPDNRDLFYRYKDQYTKLRIWTLDSIGIKMGVYIDADTVVARNLDELFTLPYNFAGVPDIYSDGFTLDINAGVLVFRTSSAVFEDMMRRLPDAEFDRGAAEQGFLRVYYAHQVVRLPFMYNANLALKRWNSNLWTAVMDELRILHFTVVKPFPEEDPPANFDEREAAVRRNLAEKKSTLFEDGIWKTEMELWEHHYNDSLRSLAGKCLR